MVFAIFSLLNTIKIEMFTLQFQLTIP